MVVVLMGVAGCGKTSVGRALAGALDVPFIEGDAFHAPASRQKMAAGVPLDDGDRWPWLDALAEELARAASDGSGAVLACSALRRRYRDRLRRGCPGLRLVLLDGAAELIGERIAARRGHYMPASLLASQLDALERPGPDEGALVVDVGGAPPEHLAAGIAQWLRGEAGSAGAVRGSCPPGVVGPAT